MELIDNKSKLLGDDLQREIKKGAKISMVASYFSIYAFEALKDELSEIEELQFIFPSPICLLAPLPRSQESGLLLHPRLSPICSTFSMGSVPSPFPPLPSATQQAGVLWRLQKSLPSPMSLGHQTS